MARKQYFTDVEGQLRFLSMHDIGKRYRMCACSRNSTFNFFIFDTKDKKRLFNNPPLCLDHTFISEKCVELNNQYEDDLNYLKEIKKYTIPNDNQSNHYRSR
jgi:hypothetical protein